jgi:hypothetical protein
MLTGTVREVRVDASGRRRSTFITVSYHLEGLDHKSKEVNLPSVHAGEASATVPTPGASLCEPTFCRRLLKKTAPANSAACCEKHASVSLT